MDKIIIAAVGVVAGFFMMYFQNRNRQLLFHEAPRRRSPSPIRFSRPNPPRQRPNPPRVSPPRQDLNSSSVNSSPSSTPPNSTPPNPPRVGSPRQDLNLSPVNSSPSSTPPNSTPPNPPRVGPPRQDLNLSPVNSSPSSTPPNSTPSSPNLSRSNSSRRRRITNSLCSTGDTCVLCYDRTANAAIYNCGHAQMCYECAVEQWQGIGSGKCPICSQKILDVITLYK